MNHIQNILKIGGSLGSFVLANSLDPTGCTGEIIKAISGNLLSNFVDKYDPAALLEYLKKPSELNHDIEKLMVDSVEKAVQLVTVQYFDENPYDDEFVKKTLKSLIEDAKIMSENTDYELLATDKDAWIASIDEYIFRGREDEDGKLSEIADFFKKHLKTCYELVFNEGLKDDKNEKPLKAFLIKSLNGLTEQADKNSEIQQKILDEIENLKTNQITPSLTISKSYFKNEIDKIDKKLVQLLEIAKKTDGNIELILQILESFKSELNKIKTGISEIKEKIKPSIPRLLTNQPLMPEVFVGRTEELENIRKALFEGENLLLLVNGEGGVGKTTLATRYYLKYQSHYKHTAWVLCEQSIADALLLLTDALHLTFNDTDTQAQRLEKLLHSMANLDAPCLLVIDNANELADLKENYDHLRHCPNFHVLLTTRITEFRIAKFYAIEGLPLDKAIELFTRYYDKLQANEHQLLTDIYTAVGGNTLVLELIAKTLDQHNTTLETRYRLADLLADLQQKGILGIQEANEVDVDYHKYKKAKPSEIIRAMYDLAKLQAHESQLLSIFAVLPAESIAYTTLKTLLPDTPNLDKTLLTLAQKGWLNHNKTNTTFKCSPVIQDIVKDKNERLYEDCEKIIDILIDKLVHETVIGTLMNVTYEEGVLYARFAESILNNLEEIEYNLALLSERGSNFYKTYGNIEKGMHYAETCISISEKLVEQYPENTDYKNNLANSYERLGVLQQSLGNLNKALEYFEKSNKSQLQLYKDFPDKNYLKFNLAISYSKLGELHKLLGNWGKALAYFETDCKLTEELHQDAPNQVHVKNGLAIAYQNLGSLQHHFGNLKKALKYFQQYNLIGKELYRDYPNQVEFKNNLAISYQFLGNLQLSLGDLKKALKYFEQYNQLREELYQDYPNQVNFKNGLAISYQFLGDLQKSFYNLDKALIYFEKDCKITEELHRDYPNQVDFKNSLAISYAKLGEFYRDTNQKPKAKEYFQKAEAHWVELTEAFPMYADFKKFLGIVRDVLAGL